MSERYTRIFSLESNLYAEGSPLVICAGALLMDSITENVLVQLKFKNIVDHNIKYIKIEISPFDTLNRPLGDSFEFEYLEDRKSVV